MNLKSSSSPVDRSVAGQLFVTYKELCVCVCVCISDFIKFHKKVGKLKGSSFLSCLEIYVDCLGCTQWRSWLRHCATSRKVAGSIPDGVIAIFHCHNPSGRTVALVSTQPLTEMSTRSIYLGVKAACA